MNQSNTPAEVGCNEGLGGERAAFEAWLKTFEPTDPSRPSTNLERDAAWLGFKAGRAIMAEPGWKLVPVEPTEPMRRAAVAWVNGEEVFDLIAREVTDLEGELYGAVFEAMLAAAPAAPQVPAAPAEPASDEFEIRKDGQRVRKDRWEWGIRRIVALLCGNRQQFEIDEVVDAVRELAPAPHADEEALARAVQEGAAQKPAEADYRDAYQGAREDLLDWKRRALAAEDLNRKFAAEVNGPTFMGEPAFQQPERLPPSDDQILAAARALNKLQADSCGVDEADSWKLYGNSYIIDAATVLRAAFTPQQPADADTICKACKGSGDGGTYRMPFTADDFVEGPCNTCGGSGEAAPQVLANAGDERQAR